jgi:hypothetical protein
MRHQTNVESAALPRWGSQTAPQGRGRGGLGWIKPKIGTEWKMFHCVGTLWEKRRFFASEAKNVRWQQHENITGFLLYRYV